MSPPPPHGGEAHAFEEVRRDHTTRRLVSGFQEQLGEVRGELGNMKEEVASLAHGVTSLKAESVSKGALFGWALTFAGLVLGGVAGVSNCASASTKAAVAERMLDVKEEIGRLREDTREARRDVQAVYQSQPKRKRQERLEQPIAEETP